MTTMPAPKNNMAELICYLFRKIPWASLCILLATIADALLPSAFTLATAGFVDSVTAFFANTAADMAFVNAAAGAEVMRAISVLIACQAGMLLLPVLSQTAVNIGKQKLELSVRTELAHKKSILQYRYSEDAGSRDLMSRITENPADQVMNVFSNFLNLGSLLITVVSVLAIVLSASAGAGLVMVLAAVPFCRIALRQGTQNYDMQKEEKKVQRRYQYLGDVLTRREYAEERTLFSFSEVLQKEYDRLAGKAYGIEKKIQIQSFVNLKSGSVLSLLLAILVIASLFPAFFRGSLSAGLLIALITAIINLVQSMSWQLSEALMALAESREFCRDLAKLFAMEEKQGAEAEPVRQTAGTGAAIGSHRMKAAAEPPEKETAMAAHGTEVTTAAPGPGVTLEFRDVSFCYPETEKKILNHCSFRLEKGKNFAFVGENGAGKTTIVKLLMGLYENYEGQILLNGKELRSWPYGELKGLISVVSQDFARYQLTIRENILLGQPGPADEERLQDALQKSQMNQITERLPEGVDTVLGHLRDQGQELSGGEWQRLAIARLLYAGALLNILDEPTAALDPMQESSIYRLFRDISRSSGTTDISHRSGMTIASQNSITTGISQNCGAAELIQDCGAAGVSRSSGTIFITHRLGAARAADVILVLREGKIAESGSHEELMQIADGTYRKMYEAQRKWYE